MRRSLFVLTGLFASTVLVGVSHDAFAYRCTMPGPFDWPQEVSERKATVALFSAEGSVYTVVEATGAAGLSTGEIYSFMYTQCEAGEESGGFANRLSEPYFVVKFFPPKTANKTPIQPGSTGDNAEEVDAREQAAQGNLDVATDVSTKTIALTPRACCPEEELKQFKTLDEATAFMKDFRASVAQLEEGDTQGKPSAVNQQPGQKGVTTQAKTEEQSTEAPPVTVESIPAGPWWQEPFIPVFFVWATVLLVMVFRNKKP